VKQRQLLWPELHAQRGYAREIAARSGKAGNKSNLDWVGSDTKHDRNGGGRGLGRQRRCRVAKRGDQRHLFLHEFGCERR